jgi:cyclohexanone monooxygenase
VLECTPGYYNNEGNVTGNIVPAVAAGYPGGTLGFREKVDSWRREGKLREDMILNVASNSSDWPSEARASLQLQKGI